MIDEKRLAKIDKRLRNGSENADDVKYIRMLVTELQRELAEARKLYMELIMEVQIKHPNESRHQTALRYIAEKAMPTDNVASAAPQTREGEG